MTPEVLACFSDSECFYHFLFMCLICIGECVSVMEKILVMNIKTSMNSLCILRPIVLSILVQTSLYPGNIRAMLSNFLRVPCTFSSSYSSSTSFSSSSSSSFFSSTSSLLSSQSIRIQQQFPFSMFPSILTFNVDLILEF